MSIDPASVATVSNVIGEGADAHRIIRVGDLTIVAPVEGEPTIDDEQLATQLGYAQPRDLRKLVKRLVESGEISGVHVRATVARTSMPNGGTRETSVDVYALNEEQALLVTMRAETTAAVSVRREMVRVFMLARRGLLGGQIAQTDPALLAILRSNTEAIALIREAQSAAEARILSVMSTRLDALESRHDHAPGGDFHDPGIGRVRAKVIAAKMGELVTLEVGRENKEGRKSMFRTLYTELWSQVDHSGFGRSIRALPEAKAQIVNHWLDARIRTSKIAAKHNAPKPRQETLFAVPSNDSSKRGA